MALHILGAEFAMSTSSSVEFNLGRLTIRRMTSPGYE